MLYAISRQVSEQYSSWIWGLHLFIAREANPSVDFSMASAALTSSVLSEALSAHAVIYEEGSWIFTSSVGYRLR